MGTRIQLQYMQPCIYKIFDQEYTDDYAINIYNATLTFKNHEPLHLTDTIKCTLISVCLLLKEEDFERLII